MFFPLEMGNRVLSIVEPKNNGFIAQGVKMHNSLWGNSLQLSPQAFLEQLKNGVCIASADAAHGNLLGFIQGLRIPFRCLQQREPWTQTWDGITHHGTFAANDPNGDCLVCVNIVRLKTERDSEFCGAEVKELLSPERLMRYLYSEKDPSIRFHLKSKGGYAAQPRIFQIIPDGRPKDSDALGYNVLFLYPRLMKLPSVHREASCAVQLLEAAMLWCFENGIPHLVAYSRPSRLSTYFIA